MITTARLKLRRFKVEDAAEMRPLINDKDIADNIAEIPYPYTIENAVDWLKRREAEDKYSQNLVLAITLKDTNELVGGVSLNINHFADTADLGYWFARKFWNQGYATEVAKAMIEHGFIKLNLYAIKACSFKWNAASLRVFEKIGMKHSGPCRMYVAKWDRNEEVEWYTIANPAIPEFKTLEDALKWAENELGKSGIHFGHGTDNAWDEAVYLISHVLNLPHDSTKEILTRKIEPHETKIIINIIEQRIKERKPAAYITRQAWFAGLPFYVDERVLVPRSPIAELIQEHFQPWIESSRVKHILDIGTGSGCIAIAAAVNFPNAIVDAVDISQDALEVAQINVQQHQLNYRVHLFHGDLFEPIKDTKYDVIIANPPYVPQPDIQDFPDEYKHEPELALAAGKDGMDYLDKILAQFQDHLQPHGILIGEAGSTLDDFLNKHQDLPFIIPEFTNGGDGVFILGKTR